MGLYYKKERSVLQSLLIVLVNNRLSNNSLSECCLHHTKQSQTCQPFLVLDTLCSLTHFCDIAWAFSSMSMLRSPLLDTVLFPGMRYLSVKNSMVQRFTTAKDFFLIPNLNKVSLVEKVKEVHYQH